MKTIAITGSSGAMGEFLVMFVIDIASSQISHLIDLYRTFYYGRKIRK